MLSKCMYSDPYCKELGLQYGQVRKDAILTNAGWFSHLGEKLGVGDISMSDLQEISRRLPVGEIFFILSEADCLSMPSGLDRLAPGINFVIDNAVWAANSADIFRIDSTIQNQNLEIRDGVSYIRLPRNAAHNNWAVGYAAPAQYIKTIERGAYYGLDVYHMQDESSWAVGKWDEVYAAATQSAYDLLWDTDPEVFKRFVILNSQDLASISIMQEHAENICNSLISKILGKELNNCLDYMVREKGVAYYLDLFDGLEYASDTVPGLPPGLLAYRVDK